jgi:hypothetical protein
MTTTLYEMDNRSYKMVKQQTMSLRSKFIRIDDLPVLLQTGIRTVNVTEVMQKMAVAITN